MPKRPKSAVLKPSDRRPWPKEGDSSIDETYAAVGAALSAWERYEGILSILFSTFIVGEETAAARRAYNSVRTFEGRKQMLQAASETHFHERPSDELQVKFKDALTLMQPYSERRNEIAHGVVDHFLPHPWTPTIINKPTFCLYPSYANFKSRDQRDAPLYCYTSIELDYFRQQFVKLQRPINDLAGEILFREKRRTTLKKARILYEK